MDYLKYFLTGYEVAFILGIGYELLLSLNTTIVKDGQFSFLCVDLQNDLWEKI